MPLQDIQLSLFDEPPSPVTEPSPAAAPPHPTFQQVEQTCTEFMIQGNRPALVAYLSQLCEQGFCEWVQKFCRLRIDFGLKVRGHAVVEFFQVGDTVQIHKSGQFYGKLAQIIALSGGIATVKAENWVVEHQYTVADMRLFSRGKNAQTD